jgi:F0F1-type ATP synthase assembly protein I
MAEDDLKSVSEDDDGTPIIPSHDPLPPPPDIRFTRPSFGRAAPGGTHTTLSENNKDAQGQDHVPSTTVSLGMGLAGSAAFGSSLIVGLLLGQLIDGRFHTAPWGTIVMTLMGVGAGFVTLYRLMIAHDVRKK